MTTKVRMVALNGYIMGARDNPEHTSTQMVALNIVYDVGARDITNYYRAYGLCPSVFRASDVRRFGAYS